MTDTPIVPQRRLSGAVVSTLMTVGAEPFAFETRPVLALDLTFDGIAGDGHAGATRRSGGREPWYPRGTEMRNERQVSLVCPDELAAIATALAVPRVAPEWIGANLIVTGLPRFSMVPPRTRLVFSGGAVLRVDGQNAPCRLSGRSIAARYPEMSGLDTRFPAVAKRLRGLVAWVEKPGRVLPGETLEAFVPEQWLY